MIMKYRQNGSLKGISILKLATGQQGKLRSDIYQLFLFLSITWKVFKILLQNPTGNC